MRPLAGCVVLVLAGGLALAPPASAQADAASTTPPKPTDTGSNQASPREGAPAAQDREPVDAAPPVVPAPATTTTTSAPPAPAPAIGNANGNGNGSGIGNAARRDCALSLDAAPLLREAASRGIQPKVVAGSACDINPADNEFFGRGGSVGCKLQFTNARWLDDGVRFTDITGVGNFEAKVVGSGIEVSIPADGGVRFRRVSVHASVKAAAACPAPRPENVLAD